WRGHVALEHDLGGGRHGDAGPRTDHHRIGTLVEVPRDLDLGHAIRRVQGIAARERGEEGLLANRDYYGRLLAAVPELAPDDVAVPVGLHEYDGRARVVHGDAVGTRVHEPGVRVLLNDADA